MRNLDSIMYLRPFAQLQAVNFVGNPFCQESEYRAYVLAHLKHGALRACLAPQPSQFDPPCACRLHRRCPTPSRLPARTSPRIACPPFGLAVKYLDYRLVDEATVQNARELFQEALLDMEENEAAQEAQVEVDATKAERKALLKAASLPDMDTLFEDVMTKVTLPLTPNP